MKRQFTYLTIMFFACCMFPLLSGAQVQTEFWGMTSAGGTYNIGTIFKTDGDANNQSVEFSFTPIQAAHPFFTQLCEGPAGTFFGMTTAGGAYGKGVIFEYDPLSGTYTNHIDFDSVTHGCNPHGSLMLASNGMMYGLAASGGVTGKGVLFRFNPLTYVFTKMVDLSGLVSGVNPYGSLVEAPDGNLYGLTSAAGLTGEGALFQYDPGTNIVARKFDFDGANHGSTPYAGLSLAQNGKLYGSTVAGGMNGHGVLFEYDPISDTLIKKVDFLNTVNGSRPFGSLLEAANGRFYGTAHSGGTFAEGTLFEYDLISGTCVAVFHFDGLNSGAKPTGDLVQAPDGKLYGLAAEGGTHNMGVLFHYDIVPDSFTVLHTFDGMASGSYPRGSLMIASGGKLFGLTSEGGTEDKGLLFEYDISTGVLEKKTEFGYAIDGSLPRGSLTETPEGWFFGYAGVGGAHDRGVMFRFDPVSGAYTKEIEFDMMNNGGNPVGNPLLAPNGKLYGAIPRGGVHNMGVLFEYDYNSGIFVKLLDFDGTNTGNAPTGHLILATNGKLYGMTGGGGIHDKGVLFSYVIGAGNLVKHIDFDSVNNGSHPNSGLLYVTGDTLYGTTLAGGAYDRGTLFSYEVLTDTYTKQWDFDSTATGSYPQGMPALAANGKIYGMTAAGGIHDMGAVYEYDPAQDTLIKVFDFDGIVSGSSPDGEFLSATNAYLYAMTSTGGGSDLGVLFEFSPATGLYTKKLDFEGQNGAYPGGSHLTEVCALPAISSEPINYLICMDSNALFTVSALGNSLSYQWQTDDGGGYVSILNNSMYSGATTDSLSITGVHAGMDGTMYRCLITSTCPAVTVLSEPALLSFVSSTGGIYGLDSLYCAEPISVFLTGIPTGGVFSGPGVMMNVFRPLTAGVGTHQIIYSYSDTLGCNFADTAWVTVDLCTGLADAADGVSIQIYPNPVRNILNISAQGLPAGFLQISVLNIYGQELATQGYSVGAAHEAFEMDLSRFSSGLYFVSLRGEGVLKSARIVVTRD